jgi:uncharacterized protein (DUF885 family)
MDDEFDTLVQEVFSSLMEFRPDLATFLGLHEYDTKMPAGTREAHLSFIASVSQYLQQFEDIHEEDLSPEKRIDRKLMISTLKFHLFQEDRIRRWEKDPDVTEVTLSAIVPLFTREFAPFEERLHSIVIRLNKYPQFIKEFKTRIKAPVSLWVDTTKEACQMLPFFFQIISQAALQEGVDTTELEEAAAKTKDAVTEYVNWLTTVPCEGEPILGRELFEGLLKVRELGLTAEEILKIGEGYLQKEKKRLMELASILDSSRPAEEVRKQVLNEHLPTFKDTLKEYEKAILRARETVLEKEFASIPTNERLVVMETPPFMRHIIPVAAYVSPARFEKDQMGIYFVTPVEGDSLKEHSYASIMNTSVHEGYPGHHLQLTWANQNHSLARALSRPPEFIEGWAHYCEEKMRDYGMTDVKLQMVQTLGIIFRAVRIIIDVKLHCGDMTIDEGISFLESEAGKEHYAAVAEVKRYTRTPTYPLSYLIGKHLLMQLQKDVKNHLKEKYSEKQFHDTLLQGGSMPFKYVREELRLQGML